MQNNNFARFFHRTFLCCNCTATARNFLISRFMEDVNTDNDFLFLFCEHLTNRFYVAVRLFSNRLQMTSKCRKNNEVAHEPQASVSLLFLPHFDVLCDLLLNRPTATWNLFVLYNDQKRKRPIHITASNRLTF